MAMPLVVALHGYGGDQNYFFRAVEDLPALCEQYGFILVAPLSGVLPDVDYQLQGLLDVPVHVSIGGEENPAWVEASRQQVETMKAMGMTVGYAEPEGETHGSIIGPSVPLVFEFLAKHSRAD